MTGFILAAAVTLTNAWGSISVDPEGATLVSYVPAGGREVLFRSAVEASRDRYAPGFNGGAPICFPWVYDDEGRRAELHGSVRSLRWDVLEPSRPDELRFGVEADGYRVECAFRLGASLEIVFSAENRIFRDTPRRFCFAFHSYFAVSDVEKIRIRGLTGKDIRGRAHVKGVFEANAGSIIDPGFSRSISVACSDTRRMIVWNCGKIPRRDYAPGEWRRFVCLEPASNVSSDAVTVGPGEKAVISLRIHVENLK